MIQQTFNCVSLFGLNDITIDYINYLHNVGIAVDYVVDYTNNGTKLQNVNVIDLETYLCAMKNPLVICAFNLDKKSISLKAIEFININLWLHRIIENVKILHPSFIIQYYENEDYNDQVRFSDNSIYFRDIKIKKSSLLQDINKDSNELLHIKEGLLNLFIYTKNIQKKPPIIIASPAKTGTISTYMSLRRQTNNIVIHSHFFSDQYATPQNSLYSSATNWQLKDLYSRVKNRNQKIKLITMVRDLFDRAISFFFSVFGNMLNINFSQYNVKELINIFNETYLKSNINEYVNQKMTLFYLDNWFNKWIKNEFHIDISKTPFTSKRYQIYQNNHIELLILDTNLEDSIKSQKIASFCNIDNFQLHRYNEASTKEYNSKYKEFKEIYTFDENIKMKVQSSKGYKYFYGKS